MYVYVQPGIAYSVTYKGTVLRNGGVGVKVKGNSAPPDSNSIFRIGSVSKVFAVSLRIAIIISLTIKVAVLCTGANFVSDGSSRPGW